MPSKVKLYMFPGSNSVYTGRLMLEHKGIDYKTVTLMPGPHAFIMLGLGFETMGVPALKIDGRRVQGTRCDLARARRARPREPAVPRRPGRSARPSATPSAGARSCRTRRGGSSTAPRAATAAPSRAS